VRKCQQHASDERASSLSVTDPQSISPYSFILTVTLYRNATSSPERVASPATYLLISKALIAPDACLAVDEAEADALAALEDVATVADAEVVAGLVEDDKGEVVIVVLDGLME
jgi:hypothetical protein